MPRKELLKIKGHCKGKERESHERQRERRDNPEAKPHMDRVATFSSVDLYSLKIIAESQSDTVCRYGPVILLIEAAGYPVPSARLLRMGFL